MERRLQKAELENRFGQIRAEMEKRVDNLRIEAQRNLMQEQMRQLQQQASGSGVPPVFGRVPSAEPGAALFIGLVGARIAAR